MQFCVVAAILHPVNIELAKGGESEASESKDENARFHVRYDFASLSSLTLILKLKLTKYYLLLISVDNFSVYVNIYVCKNS